MLLQVDGRQEGVVVHRVAFKCQKIACAWKNLIRQLSRKIMREKQRLKLRFGIHSEIEGEREGDRGRK